MQGCQSTFFTTHDRRHGGLPLDEADAERPFQRLRDEQVRVFCVKAPIESGVTGES